MVSQGLANSQASHRSCVHGKQKNRKAAASLRRRVPPRGLAADRQPARCSAEATTTDSGDPGSSNGSVALPEAAPTLPAPAPAAAASSASSATQVQQGQQQQQQQHQDLPPAPQEGPSFKEILAFCLPVVLVPLADPIMSLIDTVCLGRMADALQLAALGPASLLLTFSNYILFGLNVGTISLVAERLKAGQAEGASTALSSSLFLAACGGAAMGAVFLGWGPALLALTGADPAVLAYAAAYLRIRALALPAVIVVQVSQGGLLAQRDSLSPFRVVLATSAVSLAGDLIFIGRLGWGVAGAAWTTVLAQYLGAVLLIRALRRSRVRPTLRLPSRAELHALLDTFGVLTIFYAAKNLCYLQIQSTAAQLSALVMAAHQPVWSLWCLVSFANTPLESASLAFLPAAPSARSRAATAHTLLALGALSGAVGAAVAVGLPATAPQLFTSNAALWPHMRSVGLQGALAMLCCGVDVAATGSLLAIKDTAFVARAMAASLVVLAGFLWWARQHLPGLQAVWWGLTVFFCLRAGQSLPRALQQLGLTGGGGGSSTVVQQQQTKPEPA